MYEPKNRAANQRQAHAERGPEDGVHHHGRGDDAVDSHVTRARLALETRNHLPLTPVLQLV